VSASKGNIDKLYAAGLIKRKRLPDAYQDVLEGLDKSEVQFLISLYEKLEKAEKSLRGDADDVPLIECFVPL
jgi:hypothetical protein